MEDSECCEFNIGMECFIPENGTVWTCQDCGTTYVWDDLENDWVGQNES